MKNNNTKMIISCLSGNVLEWYDFVVYGFLTPIIAKQFFPVSNPFAAMMFTYSVFAIGFLIRPLGAIIFGHIGDKWGRRTALVISSFTMSIPTCLIGLLPTFDSIGIAAPLLLILCRICQGLSVGGEFTGSFIYLIEQAPMGKKALFGCWADLGCSIGTILGSASIALLSGILSNEHFEAFGWRIPFISGIFLALLAIYIRSHLPETDEFTKAEKTKTFPFYQLFKTIPKSLLLGTLLLSISSLGYYVLVVFIPNQTIILGKLSATHSYLINTLILTTIMISTFLGALLSDAIGKEKVFGLGSLGCLIFSYPLFYALTHSSLTIQIIIMCCFATFIGLCLSARSLFLVDTFPPYIRFTAIAISLNAANGLFGGMGPLMASYLIKITQFQEAPFIMLIIASLISLMATIALSRSNTNEFYQTPSFSRT